MKRIDLELIDMIKSRECLFETRLFLKFFDEVGESYAVCLEWVEELQNLIEVYVVLDL